MAIPVNSWWVLRPLVNLQIHTGTQKQCNCPQKLCMYLQTIMSQHELVHNEFIKIYGPSPKAATTNMFYRIWLNNELASLLNLPVLTTFSVLCSYDNIDANIKRDLNYITTSNFINSCVKLCFCSKGAVKSTEHSFDIIFSPWPCSLTVYI